MKRERQIVAIAIAAAAMCLPACAPQPSRTKKEGAQTQVPPRPSEPAAALSIAPPPSGEKATYLQVVHFDKQGCYQGTTPLSNTGRERWVRLVAEQPVFLISKSPGQDLSCVQRFSAPLRDGVHYEIVASALSRILTKDRCRVKVRELLPRNRVRHVPTTRWKLQPGTGCLLKDPATVHPVAPQGARENSALSANGSGS